MNKIRANQIVALSLKIRKKYLAVGANVPICPFNLADAIGMDVRFVKISSFEGMYLADENIILISAQRPDGRKRFTCAHELGHHVLGHGTVIDEIIESGPDIEIEKEADFFASMLLMPASLIKLSLKELQIDPNLITPEKLYILSKYIGVSFGALLTQLYFNLKVIGYHSYQELKKSSLPKIKLSILPTIEKNKDIYIVGNWWRERAIDVIEGDCLLFDFPCEYEGSSVAIVEGTDNREFKCVLPGISRVFNNEWAGFVRVSKANFAGMYQYMHEEDVE